MTDAREIIALQEFAKWAIREGAFQAADLDGLSIQEKAHELGLIEATTYNPDQHGPSDVAETGDDWFVFSPIITTAGIHLAGPDDRILGPDEVDQVTADKCAGIALSYVNQTDYDIEPEAAVAENVTAKMIAAAIRAIGRKA